MRKLRTKHNEQTVCETVLREIAEFAEDRNLSPAEINQGLCDTFAGNVLFELGVEPSRNSGSNFQLMDVELLQLPPSRGVDFEDFMGLRFDRKKIASTWPNTRPPEGMSWDDMDAVSGFNQFDQGTHTWFRFKDRHYDSEAPEGVENLFDLPIFKRNIQDWVKAGKPEYVDNEDYVPSSGLTFG